ncbi:MAG: hypothetical protein ACP5P4_12835 [Steroidobacteraceae bacterium]
MINSVFMVGVIEQYFISEPKNKDRASAALLVRYGGDRNQTGSSVEFINAALVRIPPFRLPSVRDRLRKGAFVHIIGHIQGLLKHQAGQGVVDVEIVVDRIDFMQGLNSVHGEYRNRRARPVNGEGTDRKEPTDNASGDGAEPIEVAAEAILAAGLAGDETEAPAAADAVA